MRKAPKAVMARHWRAAAIIGAIMLAGAGADCARAASSEKPADESTPADKKEAAHGEHQAAESGAEKTKAPSDEHGVELGKFNVRLHRAVPSQTNRVCFSLYGTVQPDDSKHLEQLLENRQNKVRDQVIGATRLVPAEEYDDAELTKFRRRILLRLRRTMPELMIQDVYVSDFNLVVENN